MFSRQSPLTLNPSTGHPEPSAMLRKHTPKGMLALGEAGGNHNGWSPGASSGRSVDVLWPECN